MKIFQPQNSNASPEHERIYAIYEVWYTAVDFLAASLFLVGSMMFFRSSTQVPATWLFVIGPLCFALNLMGYAKVPPAHLHIVALLDEGAAMAGWTNATYRSKFHIDNPNLELVHALRKAGVRLLVCSQALAGRELPDSAVDPDVTVSLSGVTDPVIHGQRGYSYMRL